MGTPDLMPSEGFSLLEEGLVDLPSAGGDGPVDLVAPPGWYDEEGGEAGGGSAFRFVGDFPPLPAVGPGGAEESVPARKIAGAFGAAVAIPAIHLAEPGKEGQ